MPVCPGHTDEGSWPTATFSSCVAGPLLHRCCQVQGGDAEDAGQLPCVGRRRHAHAVRARRVGRWMAVRSLRSKDRLGVALVPLPAVGVAGKAPAPTTGSAPRRSRSTSRPGRPAGVAPAAGAIPPRPCRRGVARRSRCGRPGRGEDRVRPWLMPRVRCSGALGGRSNAAGPESGPEGIRRRSRRSGPAVGRPAASRRWAGEWGQVVEEPKSWRRAMKPRPASTARPKSTSGKRTGPVLAGVHCRRPGHRRGGAWEWRPRPPWSWAVVAVVAATTAAGAAAVGAARRRRRGRGGRRGQCAEDQVDAAVTRMSPVAPRPLGRRREAGGGGRTLAAARGRACRAGRHEVASGVRRGMSGTARGPA